MCMVSVQRLSHRCSFFVKIIDAFFDLSLGYAVDKTRSRWGKARPYLLFGTPLFIVATILTFTTPDLGPTGKIVFVYITYFISGLAYSIVNIPYSTLTARMTQDSQERSILSSVRMFFAMIGGLIVSSLTLPMVGWFGGDNAAQGWKWTIIVYSVIAGIMYLTCFATTKERVAISAEKFTLKQLMKTLFTNKPLLAVSASFIFIMGSFNIQMASAAYFFKYNIGNEGLITPFLTIVSIGSILGPFFVPWMSRKYGKKNASIIGGVGASTAWFVSYLFADHVTVLFVSNAIANIFAMIPIAIGWAMCADTIEYGEWKTGVRAEGMTYSTFNFAQKVASAVGSSLAGVVLVAVGYVAGGEQSSQALTGIKALMTIVPAALTMLAVIAICFYSLDEKKYKQILTELQERMTVK